MSVWSRPPCGRWGRWRCAYSPRACATVMRAALPHCRTAALPHCRTLQAGVPATVHHVRDQRCQRRAHVLRPLRRRAGGGQLRPLLRAAVRRDDRPPSQHHTEGDAEGKQGRVLPRRHHGLRTHHAGGAGPAAGSRYVHACMHACRTVGGVGWGGLVWCGVVWCCPVCWLAGVCSGAYICGASLVPAPRATSHPSPPTRHPPPTNALQAPLTPAGAWC